MLRIKLAQEAQIIAEKNWKTLSSEVEGSTKMALAEKSRWVQGAADLFTVNLREQDVADADIRRWSALYEHHQSRIDGELFAGTILTRFSASF